MSSKDNYTYGTYGQVGNTGESLENQALSSQQSGAITNAFEGNQGFLNNIADQEELSANQAQKRNAQVAGNTTLGPVPTASNTQLGPTATTAAPQVAQNGAVAQQQLIGQLQNQAAGRGPDVAQQELSQATQQSQAQQAALATTLGGRNPAMAQRQAQINDANTQQAAAGQAALTRVQEQQAAQTQLAGVAGTVQGQNLGEATLASGVAQGNTAAQNAAALAQAQLKQQTTLANQAAGVTYGTQQGTMNQQTTLANQAAVNAQKTQNDAYQQAMLGAAANTSQLGASNLQGEATLNSNNYNTIQGTNAGVATNEQNNDTKLEGAGLSAAGGLLTASDEDVKHGIKDASGDVEEFLQTLGSPASWEYDNPDAPGQSDGRYVGPMAQDLEKSKAGKELVSDTPSGKMVDYGRSTALVMSALKHINSKVDALKKGRN